MPAHLLLVNPSTPRRRLGGWGETLHRAPGFSGLSRFSPQYFAAPVRKRRKRRNAAGAVAAVVNRRKNPKKRKATKARALGAKKMAKKKKKVNAHAKKVRAFMKKHPRATLAKASKAVAKGKRKSRRKKRRKNPSRAALAIRRARAAGRGPAAVATHPAKAAGKKARRRAKAKSARLRRRRKSSKGRKSSRRRVRRMRRTSSAVMRRRSRRVSKRIKRLNRRIAKVRVRARGKGRKAKRARALLVTYRARKSALGVKKRAMKRGFAGGQYARSHGLTRVNPSVTGVAKDLMALLPEIGAGVGSLVGLAFVAQMVGTKMPESIKAKIPASVVPWVPTITTGGVAAVAYGALRMSKNAKLSKLSVPVLIGGAAATALHALVAIQVKGPNGPISLGKKLGLPIGEFVGVSGYVDVNGQMVAVNGLGDFVGVSGMMMDASGQNIAVNGMGEYLAEEVGLGAAGQGIFTRSSLGMLPDGSAAQEAGMGREWSHGLSEEVGAESILDDGGSLSGSIFDD